MLDLQRGELWSVSTDTGKEIRIPKNKGTRHERWVERGRVHVRALSVRRKLEVAGSTHLLFRCRRFLISSFFLYHSETYFRPGIAGECCTEKKIINIPDAYQDPRFNPALDKATGSLAACPFRLSMQKRLSGHVLCNRVVE